MKIRHKYSWPLCQHLTKLTGLIYWCLFTDPNSSSLVILIYIMKTNYLLITSLDLLETLFRIFFFLIGIHYMQGWTATLRHGDTKKRSTKILKYQMKPVEFFQHWNPQAISCTSLREGGCCEPPVGLGQSTGWGPGSSKVFLIQNTTFILNLIIIQCHNSISIKNLNKSKTNKYSCIGPPAFKSGSCRLRFS